VRCSSAQLKFPDVKLTSWEEILVRYHFSEQMGNNDSGHF
jgi:hypothetical protein